MLISNVQCPAYEPKGLIRARSDAAGSKPRGFQNGTVSELSKANRRHINRHRYVPRLESRLALLATRPGRNNWAECRIYGYTREICLS
ncbi:hypothetical protein BV22DRAFT_868967 [Leucogyrophana mollusca]|uniref:Uncharacterized protein n=1 Tax=Leucogyrophana mollusca TaxID=85980 RepID=A0ACB8B275_9AGAM|nr:hypothetical protein BV22DRAFT_868967 [Leucogyrophana mollusca]